MRIYATSLLLLLGACGNQPDATEATPPETSIEITQETAPETPPPVEPEKETVPSGYDENWHVSAGWPGEYPAGFAVTSSGIIAKGTSMPSLEQERPIECVLQQFANYHPWNQERNSSDSLDFYSANKIRTYTMAKDIDVYVYEENGDKTLSIPAGDTIRYLANYAEGQGLFEYKGVAYEGDVTGFQGDNIQGPPATGMLHNWVNVKCANDTRAWLRLDEVIAQDGIEDSFSSDWGAAFDLDDERYPRTQR